MRPTAALASRLLLMVLFWSAWTIAPAGAVVFAPHHSLIIDFSVPPPKNPERFNVIDTLWFGIGNTNVLEKFTHRVSSLFNGSELVGTATSDSFNTVGPKHFGVVNVFKSPTSVYTAQEPHAVDFSSIQDRSIQGRIVFRIETGAIDFDPQAISLHAIRAEFANGGEPYDPDLPFTSTIVPEPPAGALLAAATLLFGRVSRMRRRRAAR
jgi:hypothetical protein